MTKPTDPVLRIDCASCPAGRVPDPPGSPPVTATACDDCVVGLLFDVPAGPKRLPLPTARPANTANRTEFRRWNCQ